LRILKYRRAERRRMTGMPMPRPTPKPTGVAFEEPVPWATLALDVAAGVAVPDDTELMEVAAIVFVLLEAELMDDVGAAVLVLLGAEVELVEDATSVMLK
jgi:hypothetical protein